LILAANLLNNVFINAFITAQGPTVMDLGRLLDRAADIVQSSFYARHLQDRGIIRLFWITRYLTRKLYARIFRSLFIYLFVLAVLL